jgi:hypothetical protein
MRNIHRALLIGLVAGGIFCGLTQGAQYTFTVLDPPGSPSSAAAGINNAGDIVGQYQSGLTLSGFLLSGGTYTPIVPFNSATSAAARINDFGQVVGTFFNNGSNHGFLLTGPIPLLLISATRV